MTFLLTRLRSGRSSWSTRLVIGSASLLALSLALSTATFLPLILTTVGALVGGVGFVLGVSAGISAFFERDTYADSDFYR